MAKSWSRYLLVLICLFANMNIASAAKLEIAGSSSFFSSLVYNKEKKIAHLTRSCLNFKVNSTSEGIKLLQQEKVDMAMASVSLEALDSMMPELDISGLVEHKIADSKIKFITYKNNEVTKLSPQQLRDVMLGKTTNWQELGGDNREIIVISEDATGATRYVVRELFLNGENIQAKAKIVPSAKHVVDVTANTIGAIGIVNEHNISRAVNMLQVPELNLAQELYFITKGEPNPDQVQVIEAFRQLAQGRK